MGFAVLSHHTGTVDSENHLDVLKGDVMNQFVIRALQKVEYTANTGSILADSQAAGQRLRHAPSLEIPTSKNGSDTFSPKAVRPVPPCMAAVMAHMFPFSSARSQISLPNTSEKL